MHLCYLGKKLNCKHQAQLEFAAHHSQTPHLIQVPLEHTSEKCLLRNKSLIKAIIMTTQHGSNNH